jgi:hypothetical protein
MKPDEHVECVSDFCGNNKHPGAWADLWKRSDGSTYIALGGDWCFYGENTPETIDETSPHFKPFLQACDADSDFAYVKRHFSKKTA